jgi:hypothetical protein
VPPRPLSASRWFTLAYLHPAKQWLSRTLGHAGLMQGRELQYLALLERTLRHLQIDEPFYPVRGAANSSYLYVLVRLLTELSIDRVLELGAGESTVLLDRLAQRRPFARVTLEDDPQWRERIAARVADPPRLAPLTRRPVAGYTVTAYDPAVLAGEAPFQLLLVDGPRGSPRRSRWGCLELMAQHLDTEFVIVIDDAERRGELDTIRAVLDLLADRGCAVSHRFVHAAQSQCVIATPGFAAALHY